MLNPLFEVVLNPDKRLLALSYEDKKKKDIQYFVTTEIFTDNYSMNKFRKVRLLPSHFNYIPLGTRPDGVVIFMTIIGGIKSESSAIGDN